MAEHVCGLMGFGRGLDGIHDTCPACEDREARYRATRALMPDDEWPPIQPRRRFTIHARMTLKPGQPMPYPIDDPSPGQTHYEGRGHQECALAKLDAALADAAEWAWRAYRSGYLDGISNPEPYEKLGYEKTVALAEAGATAYCAMCRIAAARAQP